MPRAKSRIHAAWVYGPARWTSSWCCLRGCWKRSGPGAHKRHEALHETHHLLWQGIEMDRGFADRWRHAAAGVTAEHDHVQRSAECLRKRRAGGIVFAVARNDVAGRPRPRYDHVQRCHQCVLEGSDMVGRLATLSPPALAQSRGHRCDVWCHDQLLQRRFRVAVRFGAFTPEFQLPSRTRQGHVHFRLHRFRGADVASCVVSSRPDRGVDD
mmetsp:Transcript_86112/g.240805  ORF Transcript_86112/g.240805 Transcript_86112/m.240805 type:complete len:212 (-) Transcript_86112:1377-2012(-)